MATPNYEIPTIDPEGKINIAADVNGALNKIDEVLKTGLDEKAPVNHASQDATYGQGTSEVFGHLKITDEVANTAAATGIAASPKAVYDVNTKNIILCIGDSFTAVDTRAYSWPTQLPECYDVHNYAKGSAGFVVSGNTFDSQLETAIADETFDHDLVKTVLVYGGYNDHASDPIEVRKAINALFLKAKQNFPSADVKIVFGNAGVYNREQQDNYFKFVNDVLRASTNNVPAICACFWLWGFQVESVFTSDHLHPNQAGANVIASHMAAIIENNFDASSCTYATKILTNNDDTELWTIWNANGEMHLHGKLVVESYQQGGNSINTPLSDGRFAKDRSMPYLTIPYHHTNDNLTSFYIGPVSGALQAWCNAAGSNRAIYF